MFKFQFVRSVTLKKRQGILNQTVVGGRIQKLRRKWNNDECYNILKSNVDRTRTTFQSIALIRDMSKLRYICFPF